MEVAFAVIGLAGQVVDTSFKIKKVIGTFQSAEEEFANLKFKLDVVAETCESVRETIENERYNPSETHSLLETRGPVVLGEIKKTLQKLEEMLPEVDWKGKRRRTRQGLHLLKKNDDIEMLNRRLDEKVFLLQTMLTLASNSRQLQLAKQLEAEQKAKQDSPPENVINEDVTYYVHPPEPVDPCPVIKTTRASLEKTTQEATWLLGFQSVFEKRKLTKKSKWENSDETTTVNETKSLSIRHRSSSYAIQVMWWLTGSWSISCSLSIPHVINESTNKATMLQFYRYCYGGRIRGVQKMFSDGLITPTTLVNGATLFEWAASFPQPDLCRFILQQNSKLTVDECLIGSKSHPGRNSLDARGSPDEVSRLYVDLIGMCLQTEVPAIVQYRFLVSSMSHPKDMFMCFEKFRHCIFEGEWLEFIGVAWDGAFLLFIHGLEEEDCWTPKGDIKADWIPLFYSIINEGVNISKLISGIPCCRTALWEMVNRAVCPHNLESALFEWACILWSCGVDLDHYLEKEWSFSDYMWWRDREESPLSLWSRQLTRKVMAGLSFPMWSRRVTPGSPACEVRQEFSDWGLHQPCDPSRLINFEWNVAELGEREMRRAWKTLDHPAMRKVHDDVWPFGFSPPRDVSVDLIDYPGRYNSRDEASRVRKCFQAAQELLRMRFDRRQEKKLYKSGYLRRYRSLCNLPGSWNAS